MARPSTDQGILNLQAELKLLEQTNASLNNIFNSQEKNEAKLKEAQLKRNIAESEYLLILKQKKDLNDVEVKTAMDKVSALDVQLAKEKKSVENRQTLNGLLSKTYWYQVGIFKSLNDQDKIIRQTILNLGLSGTKALEMRKSFESAAADAFLLGANLEDILKIQTGFADETGRAQILTNDMVKDVLLIGKGTSMGVEQATKLASQFQIMGIDTKRTMEYVQGVVDTSERMGINTTKVLNNIANNFKKLQTMSFNSGVQGYAKMAEYAEQMKIDMAESIQSSKMANNLEKSIDLAAQLQVMGGEFAKVDPFQMLYLSRNAPDEFQKRMNEMTKGLVTFRKMADGTFQKFISPADRDRLQAVAKATGVSIENLTEQVERMGDANKIKQMLLGTGFSAKDKELISGQATFDTKLGTFLVKVGEARKDITQLTAEDVKALQTQTILLKTRAQDALTFNESLNSMVSALKSTLLPLMRGITWVLDKVRGVVDGFTHIFGEGFKTGIGVVGSILGVVLLSQAIAKVIVGTINTAKGLVATLSGGKFFTGLGANNNTTTSLGNANAGKGLMRGGIGIGAAALGTGAGIGVAASGISLLANAMSKLDKEKANILKDIITTISWTSGIAIAATAGISMFGTVSSTAILEVGTALTVAAPGLLAFGATVTGIGFGINLAATGIGHMADGFSSLVESSKEADWGLLKVAAGIAAVNLAMGTTGIFGAIGSFFSSSNIEKTLNSIANKADKISIIGEAFKQISIVLTGSKEEFSDIEKAINSISNMNTSKGSAFAQLANLFNKPIQVEFSDKKVAIVSNITLEIDGEKLMQKAYRSDHRIQRDFDVKLNKLGR